MMEAGLFEKFPCAEVYALHNWPGLPAGTIATRPGPIMAAADRVEIRVRALGGHAAQPHLSTDAILCAAQTHDLAVVAQMADQILVLSDGEMREVGATGEILERPKHAYTQSLLAAAAPQPRGEAIATQAAPLLEIRGLVAGYGRVGADGLPATRVLDNIDLTIARGSTLGVIGESGSGKTTLARVVAGLVPAARGTVLFNGEPLPTNLKDRTREQFRRIQIVFQNADTVLNPAHTIERILARPLAFYHGVRGEEARKRIARLLDLVKLPASLMFISHDISTVRAVCDEVAVLYSGCKVDAGSRKALAAPPFHPYAELLISSVPELRTGWLDALPARLAVEAPAPSDAPPRAGLCTFLDRCSVRVAGVCDRVEPPRRTLGGGKEILCHHTSEELERLQGVREAKPISLPQRA